MFVSSLLKLIKSQPPKIVFLHIPKTGGTTFRMLLRRLYPRAYHRCQSPSFDQVLKDLEQFQCTEFHVARAGGQRFYTHKDIIQKQNWKYLKDKEIFVMFRDPVNRVVSAYFEVVRRSKEREHNLESLRKYISNRQLHNGQTSFLLGMHPNTRKLMDRSDLKRAMQMLRSLKMNIGILERYGESLHLLEVVTGKKIPKRTVKIENATDQSLLAEVDAVARDFIKQNNSLDQELYEYAVELFEKQLRQEPSTSNLDFLFQRM